MEQVRFASHRGFSVRGIIVFVLTVLMAAFLLVTFSGNTAHAADASWSGAALTYEGNQYTLIGKSQGNESHGIPKDSEIYLYVESTQGNRPQGNAPQKAYVIYFAPGASPPTTKTATYQTFTYTTVGTGRTFSNPSSPVTINVSGTQSTSATACAIDGIGWIVCPVMNFLAWGMDSIFGLLAGFMEVQPIQTGNTQGSLYGAWNIMRGIANIAFMIAFMIIIYAQVTSTKVNEFGLKRLLPRLIIAAIVINLSYIICAIAVDVSNILGYALQDIFLGLRDQILGASTVSDMENLLSWESVTSFILSGGTAVLALGVGAAGAIAAAGGTVIGLVFLLLPALAGLLLTILVVVLILAARQALITILVIIAPLAFVAYLLPNTEKWFDKWRGTFVTMLIFFPAFSVVFGGSQLAGALIIQNASSINMLVLGMIVQVAPLVITPLILKFSGSVLGTVFRLVNDPNKGFLDRTRNWAGSHREMHKQRGLSGAKLNGRPAELKRKNFARQAARRLDQSKRLREDKTKAYSTGTDNAYHSSSRYEKAHINAAAFDTDKERVHNQNAAHIDHVRQTPGSVLHQRTIAAEASKYSADTAKSGTSAMLENEKAMRGTELHVANIRAEDAKLNLERASATTARTVEEYKTGKLPLTGELGQLTSSMKQATVDLAAERQGLASAQYEVSRNINTAMNAETIAGEALRNIAGGVGGVQAQVRARAQAVSALNRLDSDALNANVELLKANAAQAGTTIKRYSAGIVEAVLNGQSSYDNKHLNSEVIHAALQAQALEKNMSLFEKVRGSVNFDQALVSEVIADNNTNFKIAGGFHLQEDPSLNITTFNGNVAAFNEKMALSRLQSLGNTSSTNVSGLKAGWVEALGSKGGITDSINAAIAANDRTSLVKAYMVVKHALNNENVLSQIEDRENDVRIIEAALANALNSTPTPDPRP